MPVTYVRKRKTHHRIAFQTQETTAIANLITAWVSSVSDLNDLTLENRGTCAKMNNTVYQPRIGIHDYALYKYDKVKGDILQSLANKKSCALLGYPGSGKTAMASEIVRTLVREHNLRVAITGSTGSAAQQLKANLADLEQIKAQTIHSFLGYRSPEIDVIGKGDINAIQSIVRQRGYVSRMEDSLASCCDVLVIEEVSLLTAEFIEAIDLSLRSIRGTPVKDRFGGVIVLFVGDFRQLSPVSKSGYDYCFMHPSWQRNIWVDRVYTLEFILRQSSDVVFTDIIIRLSHNVLTDADRTILANNVVACGQQKIMDANYLPDALRVFHTNTEVNSFNTKVTANAASMGKEQMSVDILWDIPPKCNHQSAIAKLQRDMVFSQELFVGAQVIVTANISLEGSVVNGTTGEVVAFVHIVSDDDCHYGNSRVGRCVILRLGEKRNITLGWHSVSSPADKHGHKVTAHYLPLLLCHAITVHRLQGSTVKKPLFYAPQKKGTYFHEFYVILTRLTKLELLYLTHIPTELKNCIDPKVLEFYEGNK